MTKYEAFFFIDKIWNNKAKQQEILYKNYLSPQQKLEKEEKKECDHHEGFHEGNAWIPECFDQKVPLKMRALSPLEIMKLPLKRENSLCMKFLKLNQPSHNKKHSKSHKTNLIDSSKVNFFVGSRIVQARVPKSKRPGPAP